MGTAGGQMDPFGAYRDPYGMGFGGTGYDPYADAFQYDPAGQQGSYGQSYRRSVYGGRPNYQDIYNPSFTPQFPQSVSPPFFSMSPPVSIYGAEQGYSPWAAGPQPNWGYAPSQSVIDILYGGPVPGQDQQNAPGPNEIVGEAERIEYDPDDLNKSG